MTSRIVSVLFYALAFSVGVALTCHFGFECLLYKNCQNWETTSGRIVANGPEQVPVKMFLICGPESTSGQTVTKHIVRYEYQAAGETMTSEKLAFGELEALHYLPIDFGNKMADYAVGDPIGVTFNPLNPDCAVVEKKMRQEGLTTLGIGVFLMILGGGSFFLRQ